MSLSNTISAQPSDELYAAVETALDYTSENTDLSFDQIYSMVKDQGTQRETFEVVEKLTGDRLEESWDSESKDFTYSIISE